MRIEVICVRWRLHNYGFSAFTLPASVIIAWLSETALLSLEGIAAGDVIGSAGGDSCSCGFLL